MARRFKLIGIFTVLLFIVCYSFPAAASEAKTESPGGGSALVCLLDASGSMKSNDKDRLAISSISRLIYSLPSDCEVGVIAYNSGTVYQSKLTGAKGRSALAEEIKGIRYKGYTDAGKGLQSAVDMLKDDKASEKTIILLSDGEIDMPTKQEAQRSRKDFEASVKVAASLNIKIHVVGLGVDMENMDNDIYAAKTATGGLWTRINNASQIAGAVDLISEESGYIKKDATYEMKLEQQEDELTIPFPYKAARKARIVLTSDVDFEVIKVVAGDGRVTLSKGDRFEVVEIDNPPEGDIGIIVKAAAGHEIKADVLPEYGTALQGKEEPSPSGNRIGAVVDTTAGDGTGTVPDTTAGDGIATVPDTIIGDGSGAVINTSAGSKESTATSSIAGIGSHAGGGTDSQNGVGGSTGSGAIKMLDVRIIKQYGILAMAGFILVLAAIIIVLVIMTRGKRGKKGTATVLKIDIMGGRFGKKGYLLCYSLFRLLQQGEISLQEVLASGGVEETHGAERIRFQMEERMCPVLVNDSEFDVRYKQKKVRGGERQRIPLLATVKIFVENADRGLVIKQLVIE